MNHRRRDTLVLLLYLPVAVILLPGLILHLTTHVPVGDGWGDSYHNLWNFWFVGHALGNGESIYQTNLLYWPDTISLVFGTLPPATGLLSLPIQLLFPGTSGLVASLNLLTLASFVLTGVAAHLLARDHGAGEVGAWAAGFLAMTVPYRFWHLNHVNLLCTQWGLFTLLFLDRALRRPAPAPAIAAGIFAALTTHSDYEITVYTALAAMVLVASRLSGSNRDQLYAIGRSLLVAAGTTTALLLPLVIALFGPSSDRAIPPSPAEAESLSANLSALFLPPPVSLLHQGWANPYLAGARGLAGDEVSLDPIFLLALAGLALFRANRLAAPWLVAGAILVVFALGPSLHIGSSTYLANTMPYAWLTRAFPFLAMGRSPVRAMGMAGALLAIAFGLLVGARADRTRERLGSPASVLQGALLLLLFLERYPGITPAMEEVRVPRFYSELAADPVPFAIMPTPVTYFHQQVYMFWQTVHGKPLTSGGGARRTAAGGRWLAAYRAATSDEERLGMLRQANVRYTVRHASEHDRLLTEEPQVTTIAPPR